MIDKVRAAIKRHNMIQEGDRIIVALSGGADSVTLLHVLLQLKDELSVTVSAAHVNHCLRAEESERDENFVRELCQKHGVELEVLRVDIRSLSQKLGESIELCARNARYQFFKDLSREHVKIATAHTLSDSLETVLMNLTRGTGIKGLCGIPPVRGNIIRPLCECTRAEIEDYCREFDFAYVTDSTNFSEEYTRNLIRIKVVPELEKINPSLHTAALRMLEQNRDDDRFLENLAEEALTKANEGGALNLAFLRTLARPILSRVMMRAYTVRFGDTLDSFHTDKLCKLVFEKENRLQLPNNVFALSCSGHLTFEKEEEMVQNAGFHINLSKSWQPIPMGRIRTQVCSAEEFEKIQKINKLLFQNVMDYDKILGTPYFRSRQGGDKLQLSARPHKTLKKLFCEKKVPVPLREKIPVLADDAGACWVFGLGADERVCVDEFTNRFLLIWVEEQCND